MALVLIMELNRDTLSYWRDLGLTPAGLKKINESALKAENKSDLSFTYEEGGGEVTFKILV